MAASCVSEGCRGGGGGSMSREIAPCSSLDRGVGGYSPSGKRKGMGKGVVGEASPLRRWQRKAAFLHKKKFDEGQTTILRFGNNWEGEVR